MTTGIFKLKCVGCGCTEERPAENCRDQPFCEKCYMPMTLERVSVKTTKKAKRHV
jgi:hypothetical protein